MEPKQMLRAARDTTGRDLTSHIQSVPSGYARELTAQMRLGSQDEVGGKLLLTIGLGIAAVRDHITSPADGVLRIDFIGARPHRSEGPLIFNALPVIARDVLPGVVFNRVVVGLIGPEMAEADAQTAQHFRECEKLAPQLTIQARAQLYHDDPVPPPATVAFVIRGGIDSEFGNWNRTVALLLERKTPTVLTGYTADHGCDDAAGTTRILRLMGANFCLDSCRNPFRVSHPEMGNVSLDGFLLAVCGSSTLKLDAAALDNVQRQDRIEKLEELAVVNESEGQAGISGNLRRLRAALDAGLHIPPHVNTQDLEQWGAGEWPAKWKGGPKCE